MASDRAIRIEADGVRLYAVLAATPTARAIWEALPLEGPAQLWGSELFFDVTLLLEADPEARSAVRSGEIAYWAGGQPVIALFFGPTPLSRGDDPVAAAPVSVFGRITGDAARLGRVRAGTRVRLTRLKG